MRLGSENHRDLGGLTFIDLPEWVWYYTIDFQYGKPTGIVHRARKLGREYVIKVTGTVSERSNKNPKMHTGDIEILVDEFEVLNPSITPPFTIEDQTDGGDDIRMKYRYLDLRRTPVMNSILLRHRMAQETQRSLFG